MAKATGKNRRVGWLMGGKNASGEEKIGGKSCRFGGGGGKRGKKNWSRYQVCRGRIQIALKKKKGRG